MKIYVDIDIAVDMCIHIYIYSHYKAIDGWFNSGDQRRAAYRTAAAKCSPVSAYLHVKVPMGFSGTCMEMPFLMSWEAAILKDGLSMWVLGMVQGFSGLKSPLNNL